MPRGRPRKQPIWPQSQPLITKQLTNLEKDYLDLAVPETLRTRGKIEQNDFEMWASKLNKSVEIVMNYINKTSSTPLPEPERKKPKLTHIQKTLREQMNVKTAGGRQGVTILHDGTSAMIEEEERKNPSRGTPSKYGNCIYRGN